jgi:hypothetical protein
MEMLKTKGKIVCILAQAEMKNHKRPEGNSWS